MKSARLAILVALLVGGSAATSTYTLRRGDTLWQVGARFGVSPDALATVNRIPNPDLVFEGQSLTVPDAKTAQVAVAVPIAAVTGDKAYQVQAGDTLTSIASRFGTTISAVADLNGIKATDMLREGRTLKVPVSTGSAAASPALAGGGQTPVCPVQGAGKWDVSNGFGAARETGRHMGDDIFAKRGTPVLASVDGTLRFANGKIGGNAFYLTAANGVTFYGAHLDSFAAKPGPMKQGDLIGYVGNTGDAVNTPTHLHYEVKLDGRTSVDPYSFLRSWCTGTN